MKHILICILSLSLNICLAQIVYDFDSEEEFFFQIEGDGVIYYDSDDGNPGGCLRIEESPNGQVSNLTLPNEFLGDWTQLTETDFISFDYYLDSFGDEDIIDSEFVVQLVGEFGKANAIASYIPSILSWQNITVNLDESEWDVFEGTWEELLMDVNLVRIRNEYIIGDEFIRIDNLNLSFSPITFELETECSFFSNIEMGSFVEVDGWSFVGVDDYEMDAFGTPENSVLIFDQLGQTSFAIAPPKYYGDWSDLEDIGTIEFDLRVESNDADVIPEKDFIFIGNSSNSASVNLSVDDYIDAIGGWQHFSFPIDEFEWTMIEGEWTELIDNVTFIEIDLEFIIGNELVFFDSFCLSNNVVGIASNELNHLNLFPNPVNNYLHIEGDRNIVNAVIYDALGNVIKRIESAEKIVDVDRISPGIYYIIGHTDKGKFANKFVKN